MLRSILSFAAVFAIAVIGGPGSPQGAYAAGAEGPCKADTEKFCKDVEPGEGRILACLKSHENELSQACKEARTAGKEKVTQEVEAFGEACRSDVTQYCNDVQAGEGRILACLKSHEMELSQACKDYRSAKKGQIKQKLEEFSEACKDDVQKNCSQVKPGKGRVAKCLQKNQASLSDSCKAALGPKK